MNDTPGGHSPMTAFVRYPTSRRKSDSAVGSGLVLSLLLHVLVLTVLVQVAWMAPATMPFDVFAAEPFDVPTQTAVETVPAVPPRREPVAVARQRPGGRTAPASSVATTPPESAKRAPAGKGTTAAATTPSATAPRVSVAQTGAAAEPRVVGPAHEPSVGLELPTVAVAKEAPAADAGAAAGNPAPGAPARATAMQPVPASPPVGDVTGHEGPVTDPQPLPAPPSIPLPPRPDTVHPTATPLPSPDVAVTEPSQPSDAGAAASERPPARTDPAPRSPVRGGLAARQAQAAPPTPSGAESSSLGLGLGRLRIHVDGARSRTTERETDIISGTLVGGEARRVVVLVEGRTIETMRAGRAFTAPVTLAPGINRVRVLASGPDGGEVEETITVRYVPPVSPDVVITSPLDGHTLSPNDPPMVVVRGEVRDSTASTVWVVANDRRVSVPVSGGLFQYVLPLTEPTVRLRAETGSEAGRSATVAVHAAAALPSLGLWLTDWPRETAGPPQVTVTWRPSADRLDGGVQRLPVRALTADGGEAAADFFYLRNARPGVYAFVVTYRAGATPPVRPLLYVAGNGGPRAVQPITLDGSGRAIVARILLPQGILWEQDDWFTGRSASGDTVTKFRFPDGVSWTERVGGGPR